MDECIEKVKEYAEKIQGEDINVQIDSLEETLKIVENAEKVTGITF